MKKLSILLVALCAATIAQAAKSAEAPRPRLMLTQKGVKDIRAQLGKNHILDSAWNNARAIADNALAQPIEVPIPEHVGGGYSHEKHKSNYTDMYNAGIAYQISGEKRYAEFIRTMLLKYADMYPGLGSHPAAFTKTPGKIFYQILNEAVWLTFTAHAYDCAYDYIPAAERARIERDLFRPMVDFMESSHAENKKAFNSMHNFGTWMAAGVGMLGYVIDDGDMVEKALRGSDKDGKTGFLLQLDKLFSPDGYYDEGPGYQRYALYPFVAFAECIDNNQPGLGIFKVREGILPKTVNALLQCTYMGNIFLLNDAIAKDIYTFEILFSTNIAYKASPADRGMLGMIRKQGIVTLTDAGAMASRAIKEGKAQPFRFYSQVIRTGPDGKDGGLAIMRGRGDGGGVDKANTCVTLKATTQGGGHGHFDRLSVQYMANDEPIIPDYGSARFINVEVKAKGGYAPENLTFAKMSIAHNTVTVDQRCHYEAKSSAADKLGCTVNYSDFSSRTMQIVSASENNAYKGVGMRRTIALIDNGAAEFPLTLDIFRLTSAARHTYDLAWYYNGHFMSVNYPFKRNAAAPQPMGAGNGYQHLWQESKSSPEERTMQLCWLRGKRFYTLSTASSVPCDAFLVRTGANDPDYNLVTRDGIIYRNREQGGNVTFVSLIEAHGNYDLVSETTRQAASAVESVRIVVDNDDYTVVGVEMKGGKKFTVAVVNGAFPADKKHSAASRQWTGNSAIFAD